MGSLTCREEKGGGAVGGGEVPGRGGGLAGARRLEDLARDPPCLRWVLFEVRRETLVDEALHDPLDLGVAQLPLGLSLDLRVRNLDADDRAEPLPRVLALEGLRPVPQEAVGARVGVQAPR